MIEDQMIFAFEIGLDKRLKQNKKLKCSQVAIFNISDSRCQYNLG